MLSWFHILYDKSCSGCGMPREKKWRGSRGTSFCKNCEGNLPDNVTWHLWTARSNCWFMRWWRIAKGILRTSRKGME